MSLRRLLLTGAAMAGVGLVLHAAAPDRPDLVLALTHPQRLADTAGPDVLVTCLAAGLAGLVWAWGALGLLLTAAGALPGAAGAAGRLLARAVLPGCARRAAAVALGMGLGLGSPALATAATAAAPAVATSASAAVPDWPTAVPDQPVPDWPAPHPSGTHVVRRGECLWAIAAAHLRAEAGRAPTDAEVATSVRAWWQANADVIGPDPDLLLPGQVLRTPARP